MNNSFSNDNGSFQHKRLSTLLLNDYINVDERDLPTLLLGLRLYAENINFYDLDGKVNGNWLGLLHSDESIFLARSVAINLTEFKTVFKRKIASALSAAIEENLDHIAWMDQWLKHAEKISSKQTEELTRKVSNMLKQSLRFALIDLVKLNDIENESQGFDTLNLHAVWDYEEQSKYRDSIQMFSHRRQREQRLAEIFNSILNVLSRIKNESLYAFQRSLLEQSHAPAAGLLISFLQAYKLSQDKVNSFPDRLLDYYYFTIQKNQPVRGGGDKVYLECLINPASDPVYIPRGSQFSAGKTGDLQDILYTTVDENVISGARLQALKTLFLQRHLLISPENITRSVTAIRASDVLQYFKSDSTSTPHSVFGYDDGCSGYSLGNESDVGLVISAKLMELKEGDRVITVEFYITDRPLEKLTSDTAIKKNIDELEQQNELHAHNLQTLSVLMIDKCLEIFEFKEGLKKFQSKLTENFEQLDNHFWNIPSRKHQLRILYKRTLMTLLMSTASIHTFFQIYHELVSRHMFDSDLFEYHDQRNIVRQAIKLLGTEKQYEEDLKRISREINLNSKNLFIHYFYNAFSLSITAETGWMDIARYAISGLPDNNGFLISFTINKSMPAIVPFDNGIHTGNHQSGAPALMIRINPDCNIYPYSYLQTYNIAKVKLNVDIKGFKSLIVQNDHGLTDRSKPFMPFGPVPVSGSCCYIGGYEFAQKNISAFNLNICWKNLPQNYAGFAGYYEGYGERIENSDFKVFISMSSGGSWTPVQQKRQQLVELFNSHESTGILHNTKCIDINLGGQYSTLSEDIDETKFSDLNQLKNGYFKLKLSTGFLAFGHKNYPRIMGNALTHNAKNKLKNKITLPEQPYTPEIESISADYAASEYIQMKSQIHAKDGLSHKNYKSTIYYITPLGIERIREQAAAEGSSFFPQWTEDGNLYIGYSKTHKIRSFNLYFNLKNNSSRAIDLAKDSLRWCYFSKFGWETLDKNMILSDSTNDFLQSGVVTLKIPQDSCIHSDMMPNNLFWLRVSCNRDLDSYASIRQLKFDTLILYSNDDFCKLSTSQDGYSESWKPSRDIPDIQSYRQHQIAYDNKNSETRQQSITRFYERLRHKNRAINSWDYERLVLEKFPQLYMVKCFSATSSRLLKPSPGHVLIVVVPKVAEANSVAAQSYFINAVEIQKIADYLTPITPPNIKLEVLNPEYERIQIRCAVKFTSQLNSGKYLQQLNDAVSDYISPWSGKGYGVKFGWTIRKKDIESYLLDLPYVSDICRFSIINIFMQQDKPKKFKLTDSAAKRKTDDPENNQKIYSDDITSTLDWSLAISTRSHHIEVINSDQELTKRKPKPVGINNIAIGSTFIIKGTPVINKGKNSDAFA